MKTFFTKYISLIVILLMLITLIPGVSARISNEKSNDNVTVSLLYNDMRNSLSGPKLNEMLDKYKTIGIDTIAIMEDDLNSLMIRGDVEGKKYNEITRSNNPSDQIIADKIESSCERVENFNYVVIVKDGNVKSRLKSWFPKKFDHSEYTLLENIDGNDVYVLYDSSKELWDYALGYNEEEIKQLHDKGFKISLIFKVKNYTKTDYLKDVDSLIKKYDIEYLNLKEDSRDIGTTPIVHENYEGLAKIINDNNLTLVVTENTDQLSNQKFLGFTNVVNAVMSDGGSKKIVRSYESYDNTHYKQRTEQLFNSTVDRNIRFITTTLVEPPNSSYDYCADYTFDSMKEYVEKIKAEGFTVNEDTQKFDYSVNKKLNSAACAVIMIMSLLIMIEIISGKKNGILSLAALILSALAFIGTFIIPDSLVSLYPTVYCVIMSCFEITVLLHYIKLKKDKISLVLLTVCSLLIMVGSLLIGSIGMGTMLSGINYYLNNDIFRGIKLSLIIPVIYSAAIYYFIFLKDSKDSAINDFKKVLFAEIKVYWVIIAAIVGAVGVYYITRSGNVSEISGLEQALRNTVTEIFPARPRTKEFLIGYPSLILLVYYTKKTDIKLLQWAFAVGTSILAASITNSFCHVFTDYTFIVNRVINGLFVGLLVSAIIFIVNLAIVNSIKVIVKKYK